MRFMLSRWICWILVAGAVVATEEVRFDRESHHSTCETIDGDCPSNCSAFGYPGHLHFTATLRISSGLFNETYTERQAYHAEKRIRTFQGVQSTDNPWFGLHTSLFYFCCHTQAEKSGIMDALRTNVTWWKHAPRSIRYDTFGCNLDHNNETIYLHAMPSNQTELFEWAVRTFVRSSNLIFF